MSFYNLSHFIQVWLLPPGLILLLMLIGIIIGFRQPQTGRRVLVAVFVLFWMLSTPIFTQQLFAPLENQYKPLDVRQASNESAAIVILGAGVDSDTTYRRIKYAAALQAKLHAPIITSGGNSLYGRTEAEMMRDELMNDYHISTLALESKSRTTQEESQLLLPILKQNNIKRIYLITHAYHMSRSVYAFAQVVGKAGIAVIPAPVAFTTLLSNDKLANFLPQANALDASEIAIHEYLGLVWYRLRSNMSFLRRT